MVWANPMRAIHFPSIERVLIYRLGSLGDTVVALPCLHQIARAFPNAERRLLTNLPVHSKAPAAFAVLAGSGLIATGSLPGRPDGAAYFRYPVGTRDWGELRRLRAEIRAWRPQALVYLTARRRWQQVVRDVAFFRACGIPKIYGAPYSEDLRYNRLDAATGLYEHEASRLARTLQGLGVVDWNDPAHWDLRLTPEEHARAQAVLQPLGARPLIACSLGTKVSAKDWGAENWRTVLQALASQHPEMGLVLLGAEEEAAMSALAAAA
jgi:heptosyltransferase-3